MEYLLAAFLVIWLGLFAYIVMWQRQVRDLRAEVEALRQLTAHQQEIPPQREA